MKKYRFTFSGFVFAVSILAMDSLSHVLTGKDTSFHLIPHTLHARIMYFMISAMLVILGFCADKQALTNKAHAEDKRRIFTSAVDASQHILNNFLNNMLYFQMQARESQALDETTLNLLDQVIHDAAGQLQKLGEISDISEQNIRDTVYPK